MKGQIFSADRRSGRPRWGRLLPLLAAAALAAFALCGGAGGTALGEEDHNLALNKWNFYKSTLTTGRAEFQANGIKFSNFTQNQYAATSLKSGRVGEFDLSMTFLANLRVPPVGTSGAQWRYSNFYLSFLIETDTIYAESCVPWVSNKTHMALQMGLDANEQPAITFVQYKAYQSSGDPVGYIQPNSPLNIADGKEHTILLRVRNYTEELAGIISTGKKMECFLDGGSEALLTYVLWDDYYDADTDKHYDIGASTMTGHIGLWANSDWPVGTPVSTMNNDVLVSDLTLKVYDEDPEGSYMPQTPADKFVLSPKRFSNQAYYECGEEIQIKFADLFNWEGEEPVSYTVLAGGEEIGEIVNGFWCYTPRKLEELDVEVTAEVDGQTAQNAFTVRTQEAVYKLWTGGGCHRGGSAAMLALPAACLLFAGRKFR